MQRFNNDLIMQRNDEIKVFLLMWVNKDENIYDWFKFIYMMKCFFK